MCNGSWRKQQLLGGGWIAPDIGIEPITILNGYGWEEEVEYDAHDSMIFADDDYNIYEGNYIDMMEYPQTWRKHLGRERKIER